MFETNLEQDNHSDHYGIGLIFRPDHDMQHKRVAHLGFKSKLESLLEAPNKACGGAPKACPAAGPLFVLEPNPCQLHVLKKTQKISSTKTKRKKTKSKRFCGTDAQACACHAYQASMCLCYKGGLYRACCHSPAANPIQPVVDIGAESVRTELFGSALRGL